MPPPLKMLVAIRLEQKVGFFIEIDAGMARTGVEVTDFVD